MKFTWGTGIACFYTLFVIVMVSMVVFATNNPTDLVQENYYEKDINYESYRQKRAKGASVKTQVDVVAESGNSAIKISLPSEMRNATGTVTLFRPSNKAYDTSFELNLDEKSTMTYALPGQTVKGLWKLKLDWQVNGQQYFQEKTIFI